ncbi:LysR family transcriptional regulator [Enhygromyxa salina]|nr:LysR family transcriptional regulator [Enhygromyxa salina]
MNWDDVRFVLAVSKAGSLLGAAKALGVDHTTVGRRVDAAEAALGVRLFTRTTRGYVATADAERLLPSMAAVEQAMLGVERSAHAQHEGLVGSVRVTSPETLGTHYLAERLAGFGLLHPGLHIELLPAGEVLDLSRREAEVAIRTFRSELDGLVLRRVAVVTYGMYASVEYLKLRRLRSAGELAEHAILSGTPDANAAEPKWLERIAPGVVPRFVSTLSTALVAAARASAGVAILPRYLGDAEPSLRYVAMPHEPSETLWLTVHRDLRATPRIRALLDFLTSTMKADAGLFRGQPPGR